MTCKDCNQDYRLLAVIEPDIWRIISPENDDLCLSCIEARCRQRNYRQVKAELSYSSQEIDAVKGTVIHWHMEKDYWKQMMAEFHEEKERLRAK